MMRRAALLLLLAALSALPACSESAGSGAAAVAARERPAPAASARPKRPPICPNCRHRHQVVPVVWGWPAKVPANAHYGGFIRPKKPPTWYCRQCHRFLPAR